MADLPADPAVLPSLGAEVGRALEAAARSEIRGQFRQPTWANSSAPGLALGGRCSFWIQVGTLRMFWLDSDSVFVNARHPPLDPTPTAIRAAAATERVGVYFPPFDATRKIAIWRSRLVPSAENDGIGEPGVTDEGT